MTWRTKSRKLPSAIPAQMVQDTLLEFERVVHDPELVEQLKKAGYRTHPTDLNAVFDIKTPAEITRSGDNKYVWHYGEITRAALSSLAGLPKELTDLVDLSGEMYEHGCEVASPLLDVLGAQIGLPKLTNDILAPLIEGIAVTPNNHLRLIAYMGQSEDSSSGLLSSGLPDLATPHYDLSILSLEHGASRHGFYECADYGVLQYSLAPGDALAFVGLGLQKYIDYNEVTSKDVPLPMPHGAHDLGSKIFEHAYPDTRRLTAVQFFSTHHQIAPVSSTIEEARGLNAALRAQALSLDDGARK